MQHALLLKIVSVYVYPDEVAFIPVLEAAYTRKPCAGECGGGAHAAAMASSFQVSSVMTIFDSAGFGKETADEEDVYTTRSTEPESAAALSTFTVPSMAEAITVIASELKLVSAA